MPNVDEIIQQPMEAGAFDDLPGKGKPLRLDDGPSDDPVWRLAYKLLRDNGFSLPWIEERNEIEKEIESARAALKRSRAWHIEQGVSAKLDWEQAVDVFRQKAGALNKRITTYNLQAPSPALQRRLIDIEAEIGACDTPGRTQPS